jgi:hypothetical protein
MKRAHCVMVRVCLYRKAHRGALIVGLALAGMAFPSAPRVEPVGLAQLPEQHRDLRHTLRQRRSRDEHAADKPRRRRVGSGYKF